jgi:anaerobic selenocysteine-containing dehydrogenase
MIQRAVDPLNGAKRSDVLISPADAASLGVREGEAVRLVSGAGDLLATVKIEPIKDGNLQVHWPEGLVLLPADRIDPESFEPDYNTAVSVEKV